MAVRARAPPARGSIRPALGGDGPGWWGRGEAPGPHGASRSGLASLDGQRALARGPAARRSGSSSILGRWPRPQAVQGPAAASRIASGLAGLQLGDNGCRRLPAQHDHVPGPGGGTGPGPGGARLAVPQPARPCGRASKLFTRRLTKGRRRHVLPRPPGIWRRCTGRAGVSGRHVPSASGRRSRCAPSSRAFLDLLGEQGPLPPTSISRRSWMRSPEVVIRTSGATASTSSWLGAGGHAPRPWRSPAA